MKNNITTIVITALISSAITFAAVTFIGVKSVEGLPPVVEETLEEDPREQYGETLVTEVKDAEDKSWETAVSENLGFSFQVPKEYGWIWDETPKTGKFNNVIIVKDGGDGLPIIAIHSTKNIKNNSNEEVIAIQPVTMEVGEGRKVTIVYDDPRTDRKSVSSYYLYSHNGNTYRVGRYDHTPWELFDDVARTFTFTE